MAPATGLQLNVTVPFAFSVSVNPVIAPGGGATAAPGAANVGAAAVVAAAVMAPPEVGVVDVPGAESPAAL